MLSCTYKIVSCTYNVAKMICCTYKIVYCTYKIAELLFCTYKVVVQLSNGIFQLKRVSRYGRCFMVDFGSK